MGENRGVSASWLARIRGEVSGVWPSGNLIGVQETRVALRPTTMSDFSAGESARRHADKTRRRRIRWQQTGVVEGMAKTEAGKWAAREFGVLASRQNGIMETVELGWMIDEPGIQILHTVDQDELMVMGSRRWAPWARARRHRRPNSVMERRGRWRSLSGVT